MFGAGDDESPWDSQAAVRFARDTRCLDNGGVHVVLFQPEIPPNTGNVIRLCANTGADLHLVRPLGFELDDKRLRRAGLDYREYAHVNVHDDLAAFIAAVAPRRVFAVSTRGRMRYDRVTYANDDALLFGPETRGLPQDDHRCVCRRSSVCACRCGRAIAVSISPTRSR